jgi:hypothetical protein
VIERYGLLLGIVLRSNQLFGSGQYFT